MTMSDVYLAIFHGRLIGVYEDEDAALAAAKDVLTEDANESESDAQVVVIGPLPVQFVVNE